ncbi:MAG: NUDIX hydrolase [Pseudomonadota bacterium]
MPKSHLKTKATQRTAPPAGDIRAQYGALCWRERDGKLQVLLVTSRRTKRWIIPKGWPMKGETPAGAALTEAAEEGGVDGKIKPHSIGLFSYVKHADLKNSINCVVDVYPVRVRKLASEWPEKHERKRKWFSRKKAAAAVKEPELARLIRNFDPKATKG